MTMQLDDDLKLNKTRQSLAKLSKLHLVMDDFKETLFLNTKFEKAKIENLNITYDLMKFGSSNPVYNIPGSLKESFTNKEHSVVLVFKIYPLTTAFGYLCFDESFHKITLKGVPSNNKKKIETYEYADDHYSYLRSFNRAIINNLDKAWRKESFLECSYSRLETIHDNLLHFDMNDYLVAFRIDFVIEGKPYHLKVIYPFKSFNYLQKSLR